MMKRSEELWIKKMKELLTDYSEPLSPENWNRLEEELKPVAVRRFRPIVWWASAAAAVVLTVSGISLLLKQTPTDYIQPSTAPKIVTVPDPIPDTVKPERITVQRHLAISNKMKEVDPVIKSDISDVTDIVDIVTMPETPTVIPKEPVNEEKTEQQVEERRIIKPSGKDKLHLPPDQKRKTDKRRWALSASASNIPSGSGSESQTYMMMANMANASSENQGMLAVDQKMVVFNMGVPYLSETTVITEIKHKQPISFGLSLRRNLGHGFSVESGVTYTKLLSEGKSVIDESEKIEQTLHYIGIPVRGNFNFVETKRFTAYTAAGGMIEKCVYGKIGTEKHTVKPLQFSLFGSVGGQLNLTNRIGIYIEPGISYFFDDGSDIETIRKENPVTFNLQAGIRFTY